jgi:hypothetical protein
MRDLILGGSNDVQFPNPLGEGIVAEVTDLPSSRVSTESLNLWGSFSVDHIGDARFDMRSFGTSGSSSIIGNGSTNAGYFAFFGGNPSDITVGGGANLMIQDTWYEGNMSRFVSCPKNDSANITIETTNLSMGGWHGVSATPDTSVNIGDCATKTTVLASDFARDGWAGLAPSASIILSANSTAKTSVLILGDASINSNYGTSQDRMPASFNGQVDQGYLSVDPQSKARFANLLNTFSQDITDTAGSERAWTLSAKNSGLIQKDFIRSNLMQAMDLRQRAPASFVAPITDLQSTDIQLYNIFIWGTRKDLQFILPGGIAH